MVTSWDRNHIGPGQRFKTKDGAEYMCLVSGAFARINKDARSAKQRKRDNREARAKAQA